MHMTIREIYTRYQQPPNLIRHQLDVARVGWAVCRAWDPDLPRPNLEKITTTLLLHDLGNIVKYKRPFLGDLESQAPFWEGVQDEFRARYGTDATEATYRILEELGFVWVKELLEDMVLVWKQPEKEVSIEARVCEYADCCVTPEGIVGTTARFRDLTNRYALEESGSILRAMRANAAAITRYTRGVVDDVPDLGESLDDAFFLEWNVSGEGIEPSTSAL